MFHCEGKMYASQLYKQYDLEIHKIDAYEDDWIQMHQKVN